MFSPKSSCWKKNHFFQDGNDCYHKTEKLQTYLIHVIELKIYEHNMIIMYYVLPWTTSLCMLFLGQTGGWDSSWDIILLQFPPYSHTFRASHSGYLIVGSDRSYIQGHKGYTNPGCPTYNSPLNEVRNWITSKVAISKIEAPSPGSLVSLFKYPHFIHGWPVCAVAGHEAQLNWSSVERGKFLGKTPPLRNVHFSRAYQGWLYPYIPG